LKARNPFPANEASEKKKVWRRAGRGKKGFPGKTLKKEGPFFTLKKVDERGMKKNVKCTVEGKVPLRH